MGRCKQHLLYLQVASLPCSLATHTLASVKANIHSPTGIVNVMGGRGGEILQPPHGAYHPWQWIIVCVCVRVCVYVCVRVCACVCVCVCFCVQVHTVSKAKRMEAH